MNPLHLFAHGGRVMVGGKSYSARRIRQWVQGERPLRDADAFTYLRETPGVAPGEIRFDRDLDRKLKRKGRR